MIRVISPGLQTTVQDRGRPGFRVRGVPAGGAADSLSLLCANRILGTPDDNAALEITLSGPELICDRDLYAAYAGADLPITLGDKSIRPFERFFWPKGQRLTLGRIDAGARGYLAVSREIVAESFAGSKSTYLPGGFGGHGGRALQTGDEITLGGPLDLTPRPIPDFARSHLSRTQILRVLPGPEWSVMTKPAQRAITRQGWTASAQTDRMGARLDGLLLRLKKTGEMVSSGLLPGTVQLPASGLPILSLVDSHCTGGYARVLRVISADIYRLGQIAPGTKVYFQHCTVEDSQSILHSHAIWGKL